MDCRRVKISSHRGRTLPQLGWYVLWLSQSWEFLMGKDESTLFNLELKQQLLLSLPWLCFLKLDSHFWCFCCVWRADRQEQSERWYVWNIGLEQGIFDLVNYGNSAGVLGHSSECMYGGIIRLTSNLSFTMRPECWEVLPRVILFGESTCLLPNLVY